MRAGCWLARIAVASFLILPGTIRAAEVPDAASAPGAAPAASGEKTTASAPKKDAGSTAASVTDAIEAEGVSIQTVCTNCNNADLSVGGLGNDHVPVVCDGLPVLPGLAQIYLLTVAPPTVLDRVAVTRGPGQADLPGSAIGGGIELSRRPFRKGIDLAFFADMGSYSWHGAKLDVSGKSGWIGGSLVATYASSDRIDPNGDGFAENASFKRRTVEARLEFRPTANGFLRLGASNYRESQKEGRAGFDALTYFMSFGDTIAWNREDAEIERTQIDLLAEVPFEDGSKLDIGWLLGNRSEEILESFTYDTKLLTTYLIDEQQSHATVSWRRPFGSKVLLRAGGSFDRSRFSVADVRFNLFSVFTTVSDFDLRYALARGFRTDETATEYGLFADGEFSLGARWDLTIGARWAEYTYVDDEAKLVGEVPGRRPWLRIPLPDGNRVVPRGTLAWKPIDPLTLRFTAGRGFRAPMPTYAEVCCGRRFRGNRGIQMERSVGASLEAVYQPLPGLRLSLSSSVVDFDDLVVRMVSDAIASQPTYQNVNVPDARFTSLTLESSWDPLNWLGVRGSIFWLDARNRTADGTVPVLIDFFNRPALSTLEFSKIPYLAERTGSLAADFRCPRTGLHVGLSAQYTGPMTIPEYADPTARGIAAFVRTPSFWVANVRIDAPIYKGLALYGGVDNVNDYVQDDLSQFRRDYNWGPLRGRYWYGGLSYTLPR